MSDPSSLSPATGQRQFLTIPGASSPPAPEPSNSPAFRIPALDRGFIVAKKRQLECNWDMFNTIVAKYDAARDGHAKHVAGFEHDIPIQDSSNADTYAGAMEGAKEAECGCIKMAELIDTYGFLLQRPKDPRMKPDAMLWVEDYRVCLSFALCILCRGLDPRLTVSTRTCTSSRYRLKCYWRNWRNCKQRSVAL